jgi:hypothetical protein
MQCRMVGIRPQTNAILIYQRTEIFELLIV